MVGISKYDREFQLSMAIDSSSGDGTVTKLTVTSISESEPEEESDYRRKHTWYTYLPLLALSTLSQLALWTQNW